MRAALFRTHPGLWIGLVLVIGMAVPLGFAGLPGSVSDNGRVGSAAAALRAVRVGLIGVRSAEPGAVGDEALAGVKSALEALERDPGLAREPIAALRLALDDFFAQVTARRRATVPGFGPGNASADAIEVTLGELTTRDEAALREPILSLRDIETEFLARVDPEDVPQVSRWAEIFSARLAEAIIPERTRVGLAAELAAYQRAILDMMGAMLAARDDPEPLTIAVETAVEDVDRALTAETEMVEASRQRFGWITEGGLIASVLLAAACGFALGRAHTSAL